MIALDTNVLVYAASAQDQSGRHKAALHLLDKLGASGAILALPVIGELLNVHRKKQFADGPTIMAVMAIWTEAFDCVAAGLDDYLQASAISERFNLQYFDALILAISRRAGATVLLSEDMQDGLSVDGLHVVNPFVVGNQSLIDAVL